MDETSRIEAASSAIATLESALDRMVEILRDTRGVLSEDREAINQLREMNV